MRFNWILLLSNLLLYCQAQVPFYVPQGFFPYGFTYPYPLIVVGRYGLPTLPLTLPLPLALPQPLPLVLPQAIPLALPQPIPLAIPQPLLLLPQMKSSPLLGRSGIQGRQGIVNGMVDIVAQAIKCGSRMLAITVQGFLIGVSREEIAKTCTRGTASEQRRLMEKIMQLNPQLVEQARQMLANPQYQATIAPAYAGAPTPAPVAPGLPPAIGVPPAVPVPSAAPAPAVPVPSAAPAPPATSSVPAASEATTASAATQKPASENQQLFKVSEIDLSSFTQKGR